MSTRALYAIVGRALNPVQLMQLCFTHGIVQGATARATAGLMATSATPAATPCASRVQCRAELVQRQLDLIHALYVLHGVKYIDLVSPDAE